MLKSVRESLLAVAILAGTTALLNGDASAQATSPDEIIGIWESEDGNIKFEMFDDGANYAARASTERS